VHVEPRHQGRCRSCLPGFRCFSSNPKRCKQHSAQAGVCIRHHAFSNWSRLGSFQVTLGDRFGVGIVLVVVLSERHSYRVASVHHFRASGASMACLPCSPSRLAACQPASLYPAAPVQAQHACSIAVAHLVLLYRCTLRPSIS